MWSRCGPAVLALAAVLVLAVPAVATAGSWPLAPKAGPHPVRAGMLDVRGAAECGQDGVGLLAEGRDCHWHAGIDIVSDERACHPRAPRGRCHRVYAVAAGRIWDRGRGACSYVRIGKFGYGHLNGRRKIGRWIKRGQPIGWTCRGNWHLHLTEFARARRPDGVLLNPLRPGGPLPSFNDADTEAPELLDFRLVEGELVGRIEDPTPAVGLVGLERLADRLHPYSVTVNGRLLWTARRLEPGSDPWTVLAPLSFRNLPARWCARTTWAVTCSGERWFRLGVHEPGALVTVRAADAAWNAAETVVQTPSG